MSNPRRIEEFAQIFSSPPQGASLMYTTQNFKTKKELKEAVQAWLDFISSLSKRASKEIKWSREGVYLVDPRTGDNLPVRMLAQAYGYTDIPPLPVTIYAPGLGSPATDGRDSVEGPHYPQPHRWCARVELVNGVVVKIL